MSVGDAALAVVGLFLVVAYVQMARDARRERRSWERDHLETCPVCKRPR